LESKVHRTLGESQQVELYKYVSGSIQDGCSIEMIKKNLLAAGWGKEQVNFIINVAMQNKLAEKDTRDFSFGKLL
jgi:hypothetical protein